MFNRWFLSVVILMTISALVMVIYLDSRENASEQLDLSAPRTATSGRSLNTDSLLQPVPVPDHEVERIEYAASVLDTLTNTRARLPYYGEIIRIYSGARNYDAAAKWAGLRARQTGEREDMLHAAQLHLAAMQQKNEDYLIKEEAKKAKEMYISALELKPDDPDVLTDLAVVHMSLLQPEESYSRLAQALRTDPDHLRANFNMGVLLHQMGSISESIPFFNRSLALTDDPDWEVVVQDYLDRHHNELFH